MEIENRLEGQPQQTNNGNLNEWGEYIGNQDNISIFSPGVIEAIQNNDPAIKSVFVSVNDDEDPDTQLIENPDFVQASGQYDKQIVNVGSLYTVNLGESLSELAGRFQTTVKKLVQLNPDVSSAAGSVLRVGQEMCIIPCSDLPFIYDTVPPFDADSVVT